MYNLMLFVHNKLVIIELAPWWQAVISTPTTGELEQNGLNCRDALNP